MAAALHRSDDEAHANATFEALLWAFSRPGKIRTLAANGEASVIAALVDRECRVHTTDPLLIPQVMRTGATIAEPPQADHLFLGHLASANILKSVALGSDVYPDAGATVVLRAEFDTGATVRLDGPGVDGSLSVQIDGVPQGFWGLRADLIRYPMGFDLFFIDGDRVMGIPRSTTVKVS